MRILLAGPAMASPSVERTVRNLVRYRGAPPAAIAERLAALEREWDIDRAVEAYGACALFGGLALGAADRRFLLLPAMASTVLLQHALQGWSAPVPLLRRLGFRTRREINAERLALKRMAGLE